MIIYQVTLNYIPLFHFALSDVVTWHLDHKFYQKMSSESEVFSALA